MRGFALDKARKDRLRELRRAAQAELPLSVALDRPELLRLVADDHVYARANLLRRALLFRALRAMDFTDAELAAAFRDTPAQVAKYASASLVADPQLAASLEAAVRREIPDTGEPERVVQASGNFAVPGLGGLSP
jgi:hypothetical protein